MAGGKAITTKHCRWPLQAGSLMRPYVLAGALDSRDDPTIVTVRAAAPRRRLGSRRAARRHRRSGNVYKRHVPGALANCGSRFHIVKVVSCISIYISAISYQFDVISYRVSDISYQCYIVQHCLWKLCALSLEVWCGTYLKTHQGDNRSSPSSMNSEKKQVQLRSVAVA
jgi:hypothetical protein